MFFYVYIRSVGNDSVLRVHCLNFPICLLESFMFDYIAANSFEARLVNL